MRLPLHNRNTSATPNPSNIATIRALFELSSASIGVVLGVAVICCLATGVMIPVGVGKTVATSVAVADDSGRAIMVAVCVGVVIGVFAVAKAVEVGSAVALAVYARLTVPVGLDGLSPCVGRGCGVAVCFGSVGVEVAGLG